MSDADKVRRAIALTKRWADSSDPMTRARGRQLEHALAIHKTDAVEVTLDESRLGHCPKCRSRQIEQRLVEGERETVRCLDCGWRW